MDHSKKRLLLKISGEALKKNNLPLKQEIIHHIVVQLQQWLAHDPLHQICIVIGGGNFWRGRYCDSISSSTSDQMGMLATIMNGLYLGKAFTGLGLKSQVYSAIPISGVVEGFSFHKVDNDLNEKKVVILTGGTGNPFFTTDSAAVLRALELECFAVAKATKVRGVFSADPVHIPDAQFYPRLTHQEVIHKKLQVMDETAFVLAKDHHLPIVVFDLMSSMAWSDFLSWPLVLDPIDHCCTIIHSSSKGA
jgi:uridylate kinase